MLIRCASESEWHLERRKSVGGSEAAAILGKHLQLKCFRVATTKLGKAPAQPTTEEMFWGHLVEDDIRTWYQMKTGRQVEWDGPHVITRSDKHPWMHTSLDGRITAFDDRGPGVLQCKSTMMAEEEFQPGEPLRLEWEIGVQHELTVTGYKWGSLAVLSTHFGWHPRFYDIERNERFIAMLIEKEREFMEAIKRGEIPDADGSDDTRAILKHMHPRDNGKPLIMDAGDVLNFEEFDMWNRKLEEAEEKRDTARNRLIQKLGDSTFGVMPNGVRIAYRAQRNGQRVLRRV